MADSIELARESNEESISQSMSNEQSVIPLKLSLSMHNDEDAPLAQVVIRFVATYLIMLMSHSS